MEQSNGRRASDMSSTSSEGFYGTIVPAHKENLNSKVNGDVSESRDDLQDKTINGIEDEDGDSGSDMDVSDASSSTMDAEPETSSSTHAGSKRKLSDTEPYKGDTAVSTEEPQKKRRITMPIPASIGGVATTAGWPAELWQQVFIQLAPAMLGRCMRVCKNFNYYLTDIKVPPHTKRDRHQVRIHDSEYIWMHSRKDTYPTMPRPLQGFTELQMFRLIGCQSCQTCGKFPVKPPATSVFNTGPGENGVRVIWPFRLRICGTCFRNDALTVSSNLCRQPRVLSNVSTRI
jgi:hypothetical protein